MSLFQTFKKGKEIRLAVVGATATGKTYLLTDLVGALEKLGLKRDDKFQQSSLHADIYDLVENKGKDGCIEKTPVVASRTSNVYMSHFLDRNNNRIKVEMADIPGEAVTTENIHLFKAVMRALAACKNNIFYYTLWKNPSSNEEVKVLEVDESKRGRGMVRTIGIDSPIRGSVRNNDDQCRKTTAMFMPTNTLANYYAKMGFENTGRKKANGEMVFKDFMLFDTDSVVNAIVDAWDLLGVDQLIGKSLLSNHSGKTAFQNQCKPHFFYLYYTFNATDVVVCDICCTPLSAEEGDAFTADRFTEMMNELRDLTSYNDAPPKNWYLALKGFDAVMRERPFQEVFSMARGDLNLTYSHFVTLFRQACIHHLLPGETGNDNYHNPFSSQETMMDWLTSEPALLDDTALVDLLSSHYEQLDERVGEFFADSDEYAMRSTYSLGEHVERRLKDFCKVDDQIANTLQAEEDEWQLLRMPGKVYLMATPIDEDMHICPHRQGAPTAFEGRACHYNQRAFFGALQLATSMLLNHDMDIVDKYTYYGLVLCHLNSTNA